MSGRNPPGRERESVAVDVAGGVGAAPDKVVEAGALNRTDFWGVCFINGSAVYLTSLAGCAPYRVCNARADVLPRWFRSDVVEHYFSAHILASEEEGIPFVSSLTVAGLRSLNRVRLSVVGRRSTVYGSSSDAVTSASSPNTLSRALAATLSAA